MHFFFDEANEEESIVRDVSVGDEMIHAERKSNAGLLQFVYTSASANIDYTISPKTFVSLNLDYASYSNDRELPYKGSIFSSNGQGYEYDAHNKSEYGESEYKLNLYFQTDFNKTNSMSIDARYNLTSTKNNSLYSESNNSGHSYKNDQINNIDKQGLDAQVNFQQQLSKVKLEEGYRIYLNNNIMNNETNGVFNRTDHEEWRHYFYTNLLGDIRKKIVYRAGAGFDMSRISLNNTFSAYNEFTPNAMLRYIMNGGQNISFNYSLTRKSPSSSALNPVPNYVDSSRIITGNPDLKPYYLNVFGLNYELRKDKIYIQPSLRYNLANNYITGRENLDENGVYHVTYANASRYSSATIALNVSYSVFNWWQVTVYGSMRYNMYEDDNVLQLNKNFWTPYTYLQSNLNYKKLAVYLYYPFFFRQVINC
jgi:outer membrane receptor protein involved in Fe transport